MLVYFRFPSYLCTALGYEVASLLAPMANSGFLAFLALARVFVFASSFPFGVAVILVIGTILIIAVYVAVGVSNGIIVVSATPVWAFVI